MIDCGHVICDNFATEDEECLYEPPLPPLKWGNWPVGSCSNCGLSCVTRMEDDRYLHPGHCQRTLVTSPGIDISKPIARKGAYARFAKKPK